MMAPDILTIGIAGGSGSGKSTLVDSLMEHFGEDICILHHDNYYRAHDDLTYEERCGLNYDHPDAFETALMTEQLELLRKGRPIRCPVYDFTVHNRSNEILDVFPGKVILVEGILIFTEPALTCQMDIKVFVDTDADIRLGRRVLRDTKERGRSIQSVVDQWENTVKPMHELYVEPSKKNADIVVPQGGRNSVALDLLIGRIRSHLDHAVS
ncbi:MAG: uridine kinase [Lachnospiraceae bacterium]|nr:uridine kinase [Lachnospiraceae bacterium]